ncbi:hypothetical protein ACP275_02G131600 [Erythranthe tilingii]
MASSMALVVLMFVAVIMVGTTLSAAQGGSGLTPAPSPDVGAGFSLPVSAAVVASSLLLSLLALVNKN